MEVHTVWTGRLARLGKTGDVEVMPDGSLLVSDDKVDAIYRITYER